MMDNVQNYDSYSNKPSSQIYRYYLLRMLECPPGVSISECLTLIWILDVVILTGLESNTVIRTQIPEAC
jgi:hypothetical protein